jgi:hypothetical protein
VLEASDDSETVVEVPIVRMVPVAISNAANVMAAKPRAATKNAIFAF